LELIAIGNLKFLMLTDFVVTTVEWGSFLAAFQAAFPQGRQASPSRTGAVEAEHF
jgi:hypothetical protein